MNKDDQSLQEAMKYMCNLPKIYVEELELNRKIFFGIMAHICDLAQEESAEPNDPKYMPLQYDVVQKYCLQGFPVKYVCSYYIRYSRTIKVALLMYYKILRNEKFEFSSKEYKEMFGSHFLEERTLKKINERAVFDCFKEDEQDNIKKERLAGCLQKKFEENWKKKRSHLFVQQAKKGQIIREHFFPVEEFDRLVDEGAALKRVIIFLDKLESERHEKHSDDSVLIPYEEYHALHEMLLENPWEKAILKEKHMKIVHKLERVFNFEVRKKL